MSINKTSFGLYYFNIPKFKEALKYLCKKERCNLSWFLKNYKLNPFYNVYVLAGKSIPGLRVIADICLRLGLNPSQFVYNNDPFDCRKDCFSSQKIKLNKLTNNLIDDFKVYSHKLKQFLENRSDLNLSLLFLSKNRSVIFYKNENILNAPIFVIHLLYKSNKAIYALHDRIQPDINQLYKEYNSGYTKVTKTLLNNYLKMLYIEKLSYKVL